MVEVVEIEEDDDVVMDEDEMDDEGFIFMGCEFGVEFDMEMFDSGVKINFGVIFFYFFINFYFFE